MLCFVVVAVVFCLFVVAISLIGINKTVNFLQSHVRISTKVLIMIKIINSNNINNNNDNNNNNNNNNNNSSSSSSSSSSKEILL